MFVCPDYTVIQRKALLFCSLITLSLSLFLSLYFRLLPSPASVLVSWRALEDVRIESSWHGVAMFHLLQLHSQRVVAHLHFFILSFFYDASSNYNNICFSVTTTFKAIARDT